MSGHLSYLEAIVIGALQGVTELFPVSSLGHSVLIPALIGGSWGRDLNVSSPESPYLAFIVGLHVATALALLVFFWRDWVRIVRGFATSVRHRRVHTADERLAWMIVLGTIPVGITGLLLEHTFRTVLGRPIPAAIFLTVNGAVLYGAEVLRRRAARQPAAAQPVPAGVQRSAADRHRRRLGPTGTRPVRQVGRHPPQRTHRDLRRGQRHPTEPDLHPPRRRRRPDRPLQPALDPLQPARRRRALIPPTATRRRRRTSDDPDLDRLNQTGAAP